MANTPATTNPYVGPRIFTSAERNLFFGRDAEARELLSVVVSQRLVLFYAQSGAGKSSLLNARLVPGLEDQGFLVLPVARVGAELPQGIDRVDNIYLFSLMLSLDQGGGDPARLARLTLPEFLARLTSDDGQRYYYADPVENAAPASPPSDPAAAVAARPLAGQYDEPNFVLIIDQFEEIFTTHVQHWADRAGFFEQLDEAMKKDPKMWVVLTLREDYVAALDPYAHQLADKMRARYYMQRMGKEAALQAVQNPASLAGRPFAAGVADQLVNNLSQIRVLGEIESWPGQYVEPVQLQVVCYQLWENLKHNPPGQITHANLEEYGDVDNALSDFYNRAITEVLALPGVQVSDLKLRLWFNNELITEAGTRSIIDQGKETTKGMPNSIVKALADRYLLRAEPRAGAIWIELVHDRFVGPIRRANRDAEAKQKELEAAEKARQEAERQRVEAEARASRRLRWLSVALVVVSLVAVVAALLAFGRGSALESANQELKVAQGKIVAEYGARAAVSEATAQAASTQAADLKATVNSGTKVPAATATAQAVAAQAAATQAAAAQATAQADSGQAASARATAQSKTASPTVLNDLWVSSDLDLNLRGQPDSTSNLIARLARGDHLTAIGPQSGPDAAGYVWQQVRTDSKQEGWIVAVGPLGTHLMTRKPDAAVEAGVPWGKSFAGVGMAMPQPLSQLELKAIADSRVEAVKVFALPDPADNRQMVADLKKIRPDMFIIANLHFSAEPGRVFTPQDFVGYVDVGMKSLYEAGVRYFEIHTEPNLAMNGMGWNWADGAEFGSWFTQVYNMLKQRYPEAQLGYPGVSPQPNVDAFLNESAPAANSADWIGAHSYWQQPARQPPYPMDGDNAGMFWRAKIQPRFPDKLLMITEFSNNSANVSYAEKGQQYAQYYQMLRNEPNLGAAFSFATSWPGQDHNREGWVSGNQETEIPTTVGELIGQPGFLDSPAPQSQ